MSHPGPELSLIQQRKKALRKQMRQRRREIDPNLREQYNAALNQRLLQRLQQLPPCIVSAYLAFDGEPDLSPCFEPLRESGFQLALPFIERHEQSSRMVFRLWDPRVSLSSNTLGFSEPTNGEILRTAELGVILLPLVAWDASGARLGMGAGYYDRSLELVKNEPQPLRIGIAFDVQQSDLIPIDPHDIPLHELISDSQRFTFPA